jgi:hypothetical protein
LDCQRLHSTTMKADLFAVSNRLALQFVPAGR